MEVLVRAVGVEGMPGEVATVVKWLRAEGDDVAEGDPLIQVEFPKVEVDLPSPATGKLAKILVKEGRMVRVGDILGAVEDGT